MINFVTILLFVTLSVNWLALGGNEAASLRPAHLGLIIFVSATFLARPEYFVKQISKLITNPAILSAIGFTVWCFVSAATGQQHPDTIPHCLKFSTYLVLGVLTSAGLSVVIDRQSNGLEIIRLGALLGMVCFLVTASAIFASKGVNLPTEFANDIIAGDTARLKAFYIRTLVGETTDMELAASYRNTLVGAYVIAAMVSLSGAGLGDWKSRLCLASYLVCACIVLGSVSRSNSLALIFGSVSFYTIRFSRNKRRFLLACIALSGVMSMVVVGVLFFDSKIEELVQQRFGENIRDDARWKQFEQCITEIGRNPLTGQGVGAKILVPEEGSFRIHNLILAAGYEMGLVGMALATLFFGCVLAFFLKPFVWVQRMKPSKIKTSRDRITNQALAAGLLCLPLIRMMVGGEAGIPGTNDWVAIALAFAIYNSPVRVGDSFYYDDDSNELEATWAKDE